MNEWTPFTRPPERDQLILIRHRNGTYSVEKYYIELEVIVKQVPQVYVGWMPVEVDAPLGYDPTFGDNKMCLCGHPYYRHFDSYDDHAPIGCKYCHYYADDDEKIEHRKESRPDVPQEITSAPDEKWDEWYAANKHLFIHSLCSGFKWDGVVEEPEEELVEEKDA